jgi:hypothetical protein
MAVASMKRACREREGHRGAGDANGPVFQGLAHDFEDITREFGEFIQEQHTVVPARPRPDVESCPRR